MRYLPLSSAEREKILKLCNVKSFEELTRQVPEKLRVKGLLDLERPLAELELTSHLGELAERNRAAKMKVFLGQGAYDHSWPSVIDQITNRGEFLTAYTPYQPEISQGTLQAIFEYQSMMAELTGMEVSNASLYDGSTAVVEAILMAARLRNLKKGTVVVAEGIYRHTKEVLESYLKPLGFELRTWRANPQSFSSEEKAFTASDLNDVVAVVQQSPNTWGVVEDWSEGTKLAARLGTKSIAFVSHALSLGAYQSPGAAGVDIVAGEGQALGIPVGFGGPYLGVLCCRKADVRQMPGRLVGATVDSKGERAFCVTLSTREQHIRREKATSNICSNQNLMALRACLFLTLMGPEGMRKLAQLVRSKAHYARTKITEALQRAGHTEVSVVSGEAFSEICLVASVRQRLFIEEALSRAEAAGMLAGVPVAVPEKLGGGQALVLAFTEKHRREDIDALATTLASGGASK